MWRVTDRWGNRIELTGERWRHILEHHSELKTISMRFLKLSKSAEENRPRMTHTNTSTIRILKDFLTIIPVWLLLLN